MILVLEPAPLSLYRLLARAGEEVVQADGWPPSGEGAEKVRAIVVRDRVRVDAPLLDLFPRLEAVARLGAGLDNIDLPACRTRGVRVVYAPGTNAPAVAEMALGLMIALARDFPRMWKSGKEGLWPRPAEWGEELRGKTLGILGYGRIGQELARRARALGMRTLGFRRHPAEDGLARPAELEECLRRSFFLTVLLPRTAGTWGMIGRRELLLMKPGSFLLVLGRGGVVDEEALLELLEAGHLGGAALDVFSREPPGDDPVFLRLRRLPNVIFTPHVAGLTRQAQRRLGYLLGCDLLRLLRGRPPRREARSSP